MNTEPDTAAHWIYHCALSGFVNVCHLVHSVSSFVAEILKMKKRRGGKKTTVICTASFLRKTAQECMSTGELAYKKQLMCEMYLQTFPDVCLRFRSLCHHYYMKRRAGRKCGTAEKWLTYFLLCKSIFLLAYRWFMLLVYARKLFCLYTLLALWNTNFCSKFWEDGYFHTWQCISGRRWHPLSRVSLQEGRFCCAQKRDGINGNAWCR